MPRPIVTRELVFSAADTLLAEGKEPSLIFIKEWIGGGSYSTIKPHLDAWNDQRNARQIVIPDDIQQLGRDFLHTLWTAALTHNDGRISQVRAEAQHQVDDITAKLTAAEQMIEHLEHDNEERQRQVDEAHTMIEALHTQLAEAHATTEATRAELAQARADTQIAAAHAATLERQVADLRADLADTRKQRDAEVGTLAEIQRQLADLTNHVQGDTHREASGS